MNQEKYRKELIDVMREALAYADNDPSRASDYMNGKKAPGFLASSERKEAFSRARKVLSEMRDRPTWFVLKCLGLEEDDLEQA